MFLNKIKNFFSGIKQRITITFSLIFIFILIFTTSILFLVINEQNNSNINLQFSSKITEIHQYFDKLYDFTNSLRENKIRLKFEPEIKEQKIVYSKPFNPGDEEFRYLLRISNTNNGMNTIALNTLGKKINLENLNSEIDNKLSKNKSYPSKLLIDINGKKTNFSVIKITRIIKGNKFDVYIFKPIDEFVKILNTLIILFIVSIIIGLLLIFLISKNISNNILKPINNIIKTAKGISSNDLKSRIIELDTKDELYELTKIINEMLDRISDSFEKQSRFISDASHELRTPISILKGYAQLVKKRYVNNLTEDEKKIPTTEILIESIDSIIKESENMTNLISSLLFLSRSDESNMKMMDNTIINSIELLDQIKLDYSISYNNKIIIEKEEEFEFEADYSLLLQSIRILIENSIKYSDIDTHIYISSYIKKDEGYITIRDEGVGISESDLKNIFDRFYRTDNSRNKETGGFGLGLSIFKRIIEIQKQKFNIESKLNEGTKISIIIKIKK